MKTPETPPPHRMPVSWWMGRCIRRRRLAAGLSLAQIASMAGVSAMAVHYAEKGKRSSKTDTVERICGALGIWYAELVAEAQRMAIRHRSI